jgi:hypothetical protein
MEILFSIGNVPIPIARFIGSGQSAPADRGRITIVFRIPMREDYGYSCWGEVVVKHPMEHLAALRPYIKRDYIRPQAGTLRMMTAVATRILAILIQAKSVAVRIDTIRIIAIRIVAEF